LRASRLRRHSRMILEFHVVTCVLKKITESSQAQKDPQNRTDMRFEAHDALRSVSRLCDLCALCGKNKPQRAWPVLRPQPNAPALISDTGKPRRARGDPLGPALRRGGKKCLTVWLSRERQCKRAVAPARRRIRQALELFKGDQPESPPS